MIRQSLSILRSTPHERGWHRSARDPLLLIPGQPPCCSACLLYAISGEASRLPEAVFVLPDGGTAEWLWVSVDNSLKLVTATDAAAFAAVRPDSAPEPQT